VYTSGGATIDYGSIKTLKENDTSGQYGSYMTFLTRANGASLAEQMRIDSAGNVGIGNTAPPQPLTVEGNISGSGNLDIDGNMTASGDAYFGSNVGIGTPAPGTAKLAIIKSSASEPAINFNNGGEHNHWIRAVHSGATAGNLLYFDVAIGDGTPTNVMVLRGDGDAIFAGDLIMADGKGINFAAMTSPADAAGMTAEILDDYEEGTWTPTFAGDGGTVGGSTTVQRHTATYTKIGRQVTASCYISWTDQGDYSGVVSITGLPFTCLSTLHAVNIAYMEKIDFTTSRQLLGYVGSTSVQLLEAVDDANPVILPISAFDDALNYFSFQVTYQTT
jgi:hypothetical protein